MIKLVLSDMDNTLVPFGRAHASARTLAAIHACLDAGVLFGPATGRNRLEASAFLCDDAACFATGVFVNGQQIFLNDELVREVTLDAANVRTLEGIIRERPNCALIIYRPDGHADWVGDELSRLGEFPNRAMLNGRTRHDRLPEYPVVKAGIVALLPRDEELALVAELTRACPKLAFANTVPQWFDVIPCGWTKANGIDVLCEALGIGHDEVCVFGDAVNDLPMFERVTFSCAVANASDEVRRAARAVIGASEDDGVAMALEQIAAAAREGRLPAFCR